MAKFFVLGLVIYLIVMSGCQKKADEDTTAAGGGSSDRYLYVTSGGCYVGTLTGETASRTIARINLSTGNVYSTLIDYNSASPGDTPVGMISYDASNFLVAVENTGGRRLDLVNKSTGAYSTFLTNTNLNAVLHGMIRSSDGGFLIPKTSAVEKFASNKNRALAGAAAWITSPGGSCVTSTSIMGVAEMTNGNILYINAAASQNRIGIITGSTGYLAAGDCKAALAAPSLANSYPTAMAYIKATNHLLVSYASATAGNDFIYAYDVNETTNAISGATAAYTNTAIIRGASAMYYDDVTKYLYVANGSTSLGNTIEKFTFDTTTKTLTRVGSNSFSLPTVNHRCISSMLIN